MISIIHSAIPIGYEGRLIEVEGDANKGLPSFNIVGMGGRTISEARERVRSAITSSGLTFPNQKLTINLAPAELAKDGVFLDLPIALSVLIVSHQLLPEDIKGKLFVGELSLDGRLRPVRGIINIVEAAKAAGYQQIYLPLENLPQAQLIPDVNLIGVDSLKQTFLHLKGQNPSLSTPKNVVKNTKTEAKGPFLDHIKGQSLAKRALTIAIAGHHNILISGPPGAGKTMLAKAAKNLLPPLTIAEQIAITKIHSLAGLTDTIITTRPFRNPHHTSSYASIIGGGNTAKPGEISLAHLGILFLDELPEYPRNTLEALRQPLEDKTISISRINQKSTYPADFMLVATMNPCPCGYLGDPTHECTCTTGQISAYEKRLSGPLLDRIDLFLNVQKVANADLFVVKNTETEATAHHLAEQKIKSALAIQQSRYHSSTTYNSSLSSYQISTTLSVNPDALDFLRTASDKLSLSARAYFKVLKVAQTIADLEASTTIQLPHVSEALQYRAVPQSQAISPL